MVIIRILCSPISSKQPSKTEWMDGWRARVRVSIGFHSDNSKLEIHFILIVVLWQTQMLDHSGREKKEEEEVVGGIVFALLSVRLPCLSSFNRSLCVSARVIQRDMMTTCSPLIVLGLTIIISYLRLTQYLRELLRTRPSSDHLERRRKTERDHNFVFL